MPSPCDSKALSRLADFLAERNDLPFRRSEPLAARSTFHIGGPAALAVFPQSASALADLLEFLREQSLPHEVVGRGSNLLFPDEGYPGVVVFTEGLRRFSFDGNVLTAEAGVPLATLAREAATRGLSGLEFAGGIPGSIGGAVVMNAGAYGQEIADILASSRYLDERTGKAVTLPAREHSFAYRDSFYQRCRRAKKAQNERRSFSQNPPSGLQPPREGDPPDPADLLCPVLLEASFTLAPSDPSRVTAAMEDNLRRRREKQPLDLPSAGSVFRRPKGHFAGQLISQAGLSGYRVGDALVSPKHAGFIVNAGAARAADVRALISHIQEEVERRFGVRLEREILYFGED